MIYLVNDLPAYEIPKFLHVDYKTCFRVGHTFNRNDEIEIMSMPVFIGARPIYFLIFFL